MDQSLIFAMRWNWVYFSFNSNTICIVKYYFTEKVALLLKCIHAVLSVFQNSLNLEMAHGKNGMFQVLSKYSFSKNLKSYTIHVSL